MNDATDTILEQLSAYMDGELPAAEARFLQRRLEADPELRATWARMQVASTCLRGQPFRPMPQALSAGVRRAMAQTVPAGRQVAVLRWGVAASVMALAVLFAPGLLRDGPASPLPAEVAAAPAAATASGNVIASPGSADLVANVVGPAKAAPANPSPDMPDATDASPGGVLLAGNDSPSVVESPIPLSAQSPTDFPLVDGGDKRSWPRSGLANDSNDSALEAYLVRHSQLLANDGLGGFVPYLDVVTSDQSGSAGAERDSPDSGAGDGQR